MILALLPLVALLACGPSFYDIQQEDSIEAYETWLTEANPADPNHTRAEFRLEELYLEKAREMKSLAGYDLYLDKYPLEKRPQLRQTALEEREQFLYDWADDGDTAEGWQKFLDEYPKAKKKRKQEARRRLKVADYRPHLEFGPIEGARINLAEDPEGPLNGWAFTSDVTNKGDKTLTYLNVEVRFLSAEGKILEKKRWPLVAPRFPVPVEEEYKVPVEPDETRQYYFMTEAPESDRWAETVALIPVNIGFEGEGEDEGEGD